MTYIKRKRPRRPSVARQGGFTLIELLVVVAILGILAAMAVPLYRTALERAHRSALLAGGNVFHKAMFAYHLDHGEFPSTVTPPTAFNRVTFAPLVESGYLREPERIRGRLLDGRVTAYDSPDVGGGDNREFWAVFTSAADPAIKLLVASTTAYPGHSGALEGLYWIEAGGLERAR